MGYLKFVAYLYLIVAAFFLYDAIVRLQNGENAIISFLFVGIAIFMFFFRRGFSKKIEDQRKNNQ